MKFDKERLEKDALNRILWDKSLNPAEYTIHYADRFRGGLSEVRFTEVEVDGDYIVSGGSMIPVHRIREIRRNDEVVWDGRRV
ncbi:MAG: DUF504 domain-containing protein [Candidatus Altiarchaeota archaeon]